MKADSPLNGVTSVLEQPIRLTHLKTEPVWTSNLNLIKLENWGIRRESNPNLLSHNEQCQTSLHYGYIIFGGSWENWTLNSLIPSGLETITPWWPVILVLQAGLEPARHKDTTF